MFVVSSCFVISTSVIMVVKYYILARIRFNIDDVIPTSSTEQTTEGSGAGVPGALEDLHALTTEHPSKNTEVSKTSPVQNKGNASTPKMNIDLEHKPTTIVDGDGIGDKDEGKYNSIHHQFCTLNFT